MWLARLLLGLLAAYGIVAALLYFAQTWILFPTQLAALGRPVLPDTAERLAVVTPDGARLSGVLIPASSRREAEPQLILGFGGNAWNADLLADYLHEVFPEDDVVAFHYRGYPPSTGRPSAASLLADSIIIYDYLERKLGPARFDAVGISIGAGVSVHLARHRALSGLVLVSPFDSLASLAGQHYWWLPVRWLLRHRMSPIDIVRQVRTPAALIVAEKDRIVPPARSEPLRRAIPNLVFDHVVPGAGHNDVFNRPDFIDALKAARAAIVAAESRQVPG